jgi:hypothetical protein
VSVGDDVLVIVGEASGFLELLWTMIIFFAWVIWLAITVLIDVFRRHDIGGWGKAT